MTTPTNFGISQVSAKTTKDTAKEWWLLQKDILEETYSTIIKWMDTTFVMIALLKDSKLKLVLNLHHTAFAGVILTLTGKIMSLECQFTALTTLN